MTDFSLRAAKIQFYFLIVVLIFATLAAIGITTLSFITSFDALSDFGRRNLMREDRAWMLPVIIDSAIALCTVSAVALNKITGNAKGRNFFVIVATVVVILSVSMNASHAYMAVEEAQRKIAAGIDIGVTPNHPVVAACSAIIAPAIILVCTHGLGLLIKAIGTAYNEYKASEAAAIDQAQFFDYREHELSAHDQATPPREDAKDRASEQLSAEPEYQERTTFDVYPAARAGGSGDGPADEDPAARLRDELQAFIDSADVEDQVKNTARMKLADPDLTFEEIASKLDPPCHTSTAWRKYKKFEALAEKAGFTVPPLPDLSAERGQYDQPQLADATV
ncbi:DUF2637 domain-containing protein (plasmid) [Rhodococcus pseudokoreensis]|uniref:DUF2637 domain-containing protein n=1 Tax=Rhodococcus pseudokoreensis TaxID=2811421 RepID=A0A974ZRV1_9NOCA|nr:DUF2637 domain-containing protein [Rhodococcus pseudokoreensis]QSE87921.1 DUF2637 domain-containing protein [Rhodococcus pseudokoreensis]